MNSKPDKKTGVTGIVLAAGLGSRMKTTKQLLLYKGKPLLHHVLSSARASCLGKIVMVLGYESRTIQENIDLTSVEVVYNKLYQTGQSSSIKAGLSAVPQQHQAALFLLGDQPLLHSRVIDQLIQRFQENKGGIVIPTSRGKRGNPVLIGRQFFSELEEISGDTGGRSLFQNHREKIDYLDVMDDAIHADIDTPEDYENLISGKLCGASFQGGG
jgi:molybdenum cofactor cytidylyltransferase